MLDEVRVERIAVAVGEVTRKMSPTLSLESKVLGLFQNGIS